MSSVLITGAGTSLITIEDLKEQFSLERVVANPAVFDIERLNHLNGHYIREMPSVPRPRRCWARAWRRRTSTATGTRS